MADIIFSSFCDKSEFLFIRGFAFVYHLKISFETLLHIFFQLSSQA
jgi:hypothetical protein